MNEYVVIITDLKQKRTFCKELDWKELCIKSFDNDVDSLSNDSVIY